MTDKAWPWDGDATTVHCGHGGRQFRYTGHIDPAEIVERARRALSREIRYAQQSLEAMEERGRVVHCVDGKPVESWDIADLRDNVDPHNTQDPDEYHDRCVDMELET